jgi:hypothetical protein
MRIALVRDVVAAQRRHRNAQDVVQADLRGRIHGSRARCVVRSCEKADQIHLVDGDHHALDADQRHQEAVAARLRLHAVTGVDQDDGQVGRRGAGDHVARVLLVPRRVGDDELAPVGREEAVGHVDRDALLPLGRQTVDQQREVEIAALRADLLRVGFERRQLVFEQHLRFVQQAADQRALAVVHAAAGDEAQQALVLVLLQVGADVLGDQVGNVCHVRNTLPASSFPSSRSNRGRSRGPGVPMWWSAAFPG